MDTDLCGCALLVAKRATLRGAKTVTEPYKIRVAIRPGRTSQGIETRPIDLASFLIH